MHKYVHTCTPINMLLKSSNNTSVVDKVQGHCTSTSMHTCNRETHSAKLLHTIFKIWALSYMDVHMYVHKSCNIYKIELCLRFQAAAPRACRWDCFTFTSFFLHLLYLLLISFLCESFARFFFWLHFSCL